MPADRQQTFSARCARLREQPTRRATIVESLRDYSTNTKHPADLGVRDSTDIICVLRAGRDTRLRRTFARIEIQRTRVIRECENISEFFFFFFLTRPRTPMARSVSSRIEHVYRRVSVTVDRERIPHGQRVARVYT